MTDMPVVSVFGSGEAGRGSPEYTAAEQVGAVLGRLGYRVATGGYGGTMEAVSRGAKSAGAEVIGVTCRIWSSAANEYVDRVIETEDLFARLRTLIELGSGGYVVLPGATGTLLELAAVWELTAKGINPRRPLVCLGQHWRELVRLAAAAKPAAAELIAFAAAPDDLGEHFPRL